MLLTTLALFISFITLIYYLLSRRNDYWKKRGVPHPKPSLLLGNYGDFIRMKKNLGSNADEICKQFPDAPVVGAFYGTEPTIIVKHPEIIKRVTTKDFYYFSSRDLADHTHKETATKNVFNENGDHWKVVRQNLTPIFSTAKMKNMFHLIQNCTKTFEELLESHKNEVQDVRFLFGRYTMDCVGSCVFGLETKVMQEDVANNPFKLISDTIFDTSDTRTIKIIIRSIWPRIFYTLGFEAFPKEITDFFRNILVKVFKERDYKPSGRNDFVDLILNFKKNKYISGDGMKKSNVENESEKEKVHIEVDDDLLVAQCFVFFGAGFETSATTASYTMYELAKNEEAQKRVIAEVDEYFRRHDGKIEYDCVTELPYLEACTDEALRLYPVLGLLTREVVEDYVLPSGLRLEKYLRVHIPVYHLHHNPDYFPEPEKYRPERFLPEEKDNIIPHTYMPFGEGPRICIGMRFAKMQMLAGLATIFKKYRVELAKGTPNTLEFNPKSVITHTKHPLNLILIPRDDISSH